MNTQKQIYNPSNSGIRQRIDDGVHVTNQGKRIPIENLTDEHLLLILPKMNFSFRRFQWY
jgi:hypothetical protein